MTAKCRGQLTSDFSLIYLSTTIVGFINLVIQMGPGLVKTMLTKVKIRKYPWGTIDSFIEQELRRTRFEEGNHTDRLRSHYSFYCMQFAFIVYYGYVTPLIFPVSLLFMVVYSYIGKI